MCRLPLWRRWGAKGIVLLGAGAILAGCGSSDRLPTAPVRGKVIYNGKPLEFGAVLFVPEKGKSAEGLIQSDGTFVLSTYGTRDGAVIGKHKVAIICNETQRPGFKPPPGQEMPAGKPLIPEKYMNYETSGLTAEVTKGSNEFTFELKD